MRRHIALLILVALVLTGCQLAPKATDPARSGTLKVMVLGAAGLDNTLVKAFNAQHPKVTVELVALPDGNFPDVVEAIRSGQTAVDVIVAPGNSFLFQQGVIAPLDARTKKAEIDLTVYGSALELGIHGGKLYGLPVTASPMVMVYNKEALEAAGITPPTEAWTWEQFGDAARKLSEQAKAQNKAKTWGAGIPPWVLVDLLVTAGKGPADADLSALQARLTDFHRWMIVERSVADFSVGSSEYEYFQAFGRGEIPLMINYWGVSFGHAKPTFAWSTAPLPGSAGGAVPGTVTLAMMTANAQNPEAAFNFVQIASGQVAAQSLGSLPGSPIPGFVTDLTLKQWQTHAGMRGEGAFMLKQRYLPTPEYNEELVTLLLKEVDVTLAGEKNPADAIRDFQQARTPFLSKK